MLVIVTDDGVRCCELIDAHQFLWVGSVTPFTMHICYAGEHISVCECDGAVHANT